MSKRWLFDFPEHPRSLFHDRWRPQPHQLWRRFLDQLQRVKVTIQQVAAVRRDEEDVGMGDPPPARVGMTRQWPLANGSMSRIA